MKEEKHTIIRAYALQYKKASKKRKGTIVQEVVSLTGYHIKHAIELLNNPPTKRRKLFKRNKPSKYQVVLPKLKRLWGVSNFACGKILVPAIPSLLEQLWRFLFH